MKTCDRYLLSEHSEVEREVKPGMEFPAYLSLILTDFFFFLIRSEIDLGERNVKISYVFLTYMSPSLLQGTSIRMNPNSPTHTREE